MAWWSMRFVIPAARVVVEVFPQLDESFTAFIAPPAGYDHSYYFISTFMVDHVAWHAERLRRG
jgi:hypothetical protein